MNFVKLGPDIALNLDSVASITWEGMGTRLVANVRYLISSPKAARGHSQLVSEKFTGDAAHTLYKYLSVQGSNIQSAAEEQRSTAGTATRPNDTASAEPVDLLADGLGIKKKGWYYVEDSRRRGYFIALINAKGSCSMRTFDAETGRFLGKRYRKAASFQVSFVPQLKNPRELSVDEQPNLERDCRQQLPQNILSQLKTQV